MFQQKSRDEVKAKSIKDAEAYFTLLEAAGAGKKRHFVPKFFWL